MVERGKKLTIRVADEELAVLQGLAEAAGVTASDYVRNWIRQQGLVARIERAWGDFRRGHQDALATLTARKKIDFPKAVKRLEPLLDLAHADHWRGRPVYNTWQMYRNTLRAVNASENSLTQEFDRLDKVVGEWVRNVREDKPG
jgi:hypothetical protein